MADGCAPICSPAAADSVLGATLVVEMPHGICALPLSDTKFAAVYVSCVVKLSRHDQLTWSRLTLLCEVRHIRCLRSIWAPLNRALGIVSSLRVGLLLG